MARKHGNVERQKWGSLEEGNVQSYRIHSLEEERESAGKETGESESSSFGRDGSVGRRSLGSTLASGVAAVRGVGGVARGNGDVGSREFEDNGSSDDALVVEGRTGREQEVGLASGDVLRRDRARVVGPLGEGGLEATVDIKEQLRSATSTSIREKSGEGRTKRIHSRVFDPEC